MNLSNKERDALALGKSFCWKRSVFNNVNDWTDFKGKLKHYRVKFYTQLKAHEREVLKTIKSNSDNDANEDDD